MSKQKHWGIQNGEVVQAGPFATLLDTVAAPTKGEATKLLLSQLEQRQKHGSPNLTVKNGAFLMVWHNGHEFVCESGTLDRANSPLCVSGASTRTQAAQDKSFAYYASEEYQAQSRASVATPSE